MFQTIFSRIHSYTWGIKNPWSLFRIPRNSRKERNNKKKNRRINSINKKHHLTWLISNPALLIKNPDISNLSHPLQTHSTLKFKKKIKTAF